MPLHHARRGKLSLRASRRSPLPIRCKYAGELQKAKKLDMSATTFFNKVKQLSDTLTAIGQPLRPEEFTGYLLAGLDSDYDALAQIVGARSVSDPMPIRDLYAQILSNEQRIEARKAELGVDLHASANYANKSGGGKSPFQTPYRSDQRAPNKPNYFNNKSPGGGSNSYNNDRRGSTPNSAGNGNRPTCQICEKVGHVASCCFKRFNRNFLGACNDGRYMEKQIAAFSVTHGTTSSYPVDPSWYADTGATNHLTHELDKLQMREPYQGKDHVHTANGEGMCITHVGQSILPTSSPRPLHLKNILHVPSVTRNLLSVRRFAQDNNVFFEFHPWYFFVKDRDTREVLLRGGCRGNLYSLNAASIKQVFSSVKVSRERWHSRLGHPATQIVQHVLHRHELPSV